MGIALHSVTPCRALDSRRLVVTCPPSVPVGALLTLIVSVRAIKNVALAHAFDKPDGWSVSVEKTNWVASADYRELRAYHRFKQAGDESWIFRSETQVPSRAGLLVAWTGIDPSGSGVIGSTSNGSASDVTPHTISGLTIDTIGNVQVAATTHRRSDVANGPPGFDPLGDARQPGDGTRVSAAAITAWWRTATATGASGDFSYTPSAADDYCTVTLELGIKATAVAPTGLTFGGFSVPALQGVARLAHSVDVTMATFDEAVKREQNTPILLAELQPLESDAPGAVAATENFSSGYYSKAYLPAIRRWPALSREISSEQRIGGRAGRTAGDLELLNDRAAVPDVD